MVKSSDKSQSTKTIYSNRNLKVKQEEQKVVQPKPIETSGTTILAREHPSDSPNVILIGLVVDVKMWMELYIILLVVSIGSCIKCRIMLFFPF